MAPTIRLSNRARWTLGLAAAGLCASGAVATFGPAGISGGDSTAPVSDLVVAQPRLAGFSEQRLAAELGTAYGFHFMSAAEPADQGSVDMATARDSGGDRMRVIVFGRAPGAVHALACEFTPAHGAAGVAGVAGAAGGVTPTLTGFLDACARVGAGASQADTAARWVAQAKTELAAMPVSPGPSATPTPSMTQAGPGAQTGHGTWAEREHLTRKARFAAVGFAVRRLPSTGEWIISMTGETP